MYKKIVELEDKNMFYTCIQGMVLFIQDVQLA